MSMRRDRLAGVAMVMLLMLGFATKGLLIAPPSPPSIVAAGEFNTSRAIARLQRILGDQRPHSVDTAGDDAVRSHLVSELRERLVFSQEVHEAQVIAARPPDRRLMSCSHVRNVVVTIPRASAKPAPSF